MRDPLDEGFDTRYIEHSRWKSGFWRAKVISIADPQARGRIQVRIFHLHPPSLPAGANVGAIAPPPSTVVDQSGATQGQISGVGGVPGGVPEPGIADAQCPWAEPAFPFGGNRGFEGGFIMLPYVGSTVWVGFEMGYVGRPIWFGAWPGAAELPGEVLAQPDLNRIIKTQAGCFLYFGDSPSYKMSKIGTLLTPTDTESLSVRNLEIREDTKTVHLQDGAAGTGTILDMTETDAQLSQGNTTTGARVKVEATKATIAMGATAKAEVTATEAKISYGAVTAAVNAAGASINAGANTISVTPAGVVTISGAGVLNITAGGLVTLNAPAVDVTSAGTVALNAVGVVTLGAGAAFGVMLSAMIAKYNNHTHDTPAGPSSWPGSPAAVPNAQSLIPGTDSSLTILARV